ncbi:MAG: hypothetical protein PHI63_03690 [Patescibacteria group bacterium]|nr:hypothetical protein [Patescibacteria group bacterium]
MAVSINGYEKYVDEIVALCLTQVEKMRGITDDQMVAIIDAAKKEVVIQMAHLDKARVHLKELGMIDPKIIAIAKRELNPPKKAGEGIEFELDEELNPGVAAR